MARRPRAPRFPHVDRRVRRLASGEASVHYFYRPLGLVAGRLPAPTDPQFEYAYAARAAEFRDRHQPNAQPRILGDLRILFRSSAEWRALSRSQQSSYERAFDAIRQRWPDSTPLRGGMDHAKMRPVIVAWFRTFEATPATANMHKAGLSRLLSFGLERGLLARNQALGVKRLATASRAAIVWTADEIRLAINTMPQEFSAAVALAYATAQRQGDLLTLTWNDVADDGVTFRPSKQQNNLRQRLLVPMYDELTVALAKIPRRGITVLTTKAGKPWVKDSFRHDFKDACRQAALPEGLHFHDLRGSALKAFADAGCSELEIRAISGHSMKSLPGALGSYIHAWRSLAESAVRKREHKMRTKSANG